MSAGPLQVLMVEDSDADATLLSEIIAESASQDVQLTRAHSFWDAKLSLEQHSFHAMLVDLGLPDCDSEDVVLRLQADAPSVPIVVLTGMRCEKTAKQMVEAGAQDYLIKGEISAGGLVRSLKYAIQRHRMKRELWMKTDHLRQSNVRLYRLSHFDPLTKVLNRRGFQSALAKEVRVAKENSTPITALLIDMDHFKAINDNYTHAAGDLALATVGRCLKDVFASRGHVGRVGGDEFMVLLKRRYAADAIHLANAFKETLSRKRVRLDGRNLPPLSASVGLVETSPVELGFAKLLGLCHAPLALDKKVKVGLP